jgi:hypothetical protein
MKKAKTCDFDSIFPLVNKTKAELKGAAGRIVRAKYVVDRMTWLLAVYNCSQIEFVQELEDEEPPSETFYALHAAALAAKDEAHQTRWRILERVALTKKLSAQHAKLRAICKHYEASVSLAKNGAYFKFKHNKNKVYTDDFSTDMAKHAFPNWDEIEYEAEVPGDVSDSFVKHMNIFKEIRDKEREEERETKAKRAHIEQEEHARRVAQLPWSILRT